MSLARHLTGRFLVVLGAIGFVACLAGVAGVWIAGSDFQRANSEVFRQVDELVLQLDQRAAQTGDVVGETRALVGELKQTLRDAAPGLVAERVVSLPELDNLERRLASSMERADGLVQITASTAELIERLLATFGIVAKLDIVQEQLAEFRGRLGKTKYRLGQLQDRIRTWILAGQDLIMLLMVWMGAGQYCLVLQGWRISRAKARRVGDAEAVADGRR